MQNRTCYLFIFDGFADWEPSHVTTSLSKYSDFQIKTFSVHGNNVRSMGNLNIKPDYDLEEAEKAEFELLLLPGGDLWEENGNMEISEMVLQAFVKQTTIAAICAATVFLAKIGLLNQIKHTSNGLNYLKDHCPDYNAGQYYVNQPCINDKNIITANGAAMLEFSYAIFDHFQIFSKPDLTKWFDLYKSAGTLL